jgi:CheY-like chemotaxis protein
MIDPEVIQPTIDRAVHTVLVVDDNPATRYATGRVIRAAGFRTAEAGSGAEALDLVAAGVSAVVLDVHLPDLLGYEVCRLLRTRASTADLPVIYVSAMYISQADQQHGMQTGADAYLVSPVDTGTLLATLDQLIQDRPAMTH